MEAMPHTTLATLSSPFYNVPPRVALLYFQFSRFNTFAHVISIINMNEEDTALTSVEAGTEEESLQNLGEVQSPQHAQKRSLDQQKTRTVIRGSKGIQLQLIVSGWSSFILILQLQRSHYLCVRIGLFIFITYGKILRHARSSIPIYYAT